MNEFLRQLDIYITDAFTHGRKVELNGGKVISIKCVYGGGFGITNITCEVDSGTVTIINFQMMEVMKVVNERVITMTLLNICDREKYEYKFVIDLK